MEGPPKPIPPPGPGPMVLGPYAVAMRRGETLRKRRIMAATSVFALLMVLGLGSVWVVGDFGGQRRGDEPAAASLVTSAPTRTPAPTVLAPGRMPQGPGGSREADPVDVAPTPPPEPAEPEPEPEPAEPEPEPAVDATRRTDEGTGLMTASVVEDLGSLSDDSGPAADETGRAMETPPRRGWICEGETRLQDPLGRDWSVGRVSFAVEPGYERVVLHLERVGRGSGAAPSVTLRALPTSSLRSVAPGVRRPSAGPTTVTLLLENGIAGNLGLRGYRPRGLVTIKEFSVYPAPRGSSRVLVSTTADPCFRIRVPAWSGTGADTARAQVILDVRP